jgi:hypothetical protein
VSQVNPFEIEIDLNESVVLEEEQIAINSNNLLVNNSKFE